MRNKNRSENYCDNECAEFEFSFKNNWTQSTVTTEYLLICDRESYIHDLNSLGFFGFFCCNMWVRLSLVVFLISWEKFKGGFVADQIGRKPFIILSTAMIILLSLGMVFLRDFGLPVYAAGRFLTMNFCMQSIVGFQLCMDVGSTYSNI